jgi:predicted methyltransferase
MKFDRQTEKIIRVLLGAKNNKLDIWQLSRRSGCLLDVIKSVESLHKRGLVNIGSTAISLKNKNKLPRYILKKEKGLKDIMRQYLKYRKSVDFDNDNYDQLELLPKAASNKLSMMMKKNDLLNRDILCIGDDDLFSVAMSLTGLPKSITVFDIDEKIINFIKKASPRLPVSIKAVNINLLKPLPKKYRDSFDVFVAEPPDTVKGTLLFVSRGIDALRQGGVFYLGMTDVTLSKKQWLKIEKTVTQAGILFTDIIPDFEEYITINDELTWKGFNKLPKWINKPAKNPWFVSTLFRGEIAGKKKPIRISFKNVEKELITSLL